MPKLVFLWENNEAKPSHPNPDLRSPPTVRLPSAKSPSKVNPSAVRRVDELTSSRSGPNCSRPNGAHAEALPALVEDPGTTGDTGAGVEQKGKPLGVFNITLCGILAVDLPLNIPYIL
jgi:hypothetical protein